MENHSDLNGALLSTLWPGLGQLAQGRVGIGLVFVCWSAFAIVGMMFVAETTGAQLLAGVDVALAAVWAIVDAYRHPPASTRRVASYPPLLLP